MSEKSSSIFNYLKFSKGDLLIGVPAASRSGVYRKWVCAGGRVIQKEEVLFLHK